jgi:hypothetical protein
VKSVITMGRNTHFRYLPHPDYPEPELPYADYTVVRLWEDVLALLPNALASLPDAIAAWVEDEPLATCQRIRAFLDSLEGKPLRGEVEEAYVALEWFSRRFLSSGHIAGPRLIVWSVKDHVRLTWWSDPTSTLVVPVAGTVTMHVDDLIAEVTRFDGAFLAAMTVHVKQLVKQGGLPGVRIDLNQLELEDVQRARWLPQAMRKAARHEPDWAPALAWLEAHGAKVGFDGATE